jgi:hypothetical protein
MLERCRRHTGDAKGALEEGNSRKAESAPKTKDG